MPIGGDGSVAETLGIRRSTITVVETPAETGGANLVNYNDDAVGAVKNSSLLGSFRNARAMQELRSSAESTPGLASDINGDLKLDSSTTDEDEVDSLQDDASSLSEAGELKPYGLPIATLPTGLCYDPRMRYHAEVASADESSVHPEDPRRIYHIYQELCEAGLVHGEGKSRPLARQLLLRIDAREATEEECCLVHTSGHYKAVKDTKGITVSVCPPSKYSINGQFRLDRRRTDLDV